MGKITRRDMLKTGACLVAGGGLGLALAPPAEARLVQCPPQLRRPTFGRNVNVIQVDLIPWAGDDPHGLDKHSVLYTLFVVAHLGVPEPMKIDLSDPVNVKTGMSQIVAVRPIRTWLHRTQAMAAIAKHASEIISEDENDWEKIADQLAHAVAMAEDAIIDL